MTNLLRLQITSLLLAIAAVSILPAATITIPAVSRGYIDSRGESSFSDTEQYLAAATIDAEGALEYRNEFLFLIPPLSGTLQSAALHLDTGAIQILEPAGKSFLLTSSPILFATFTDLGAGLAYGSRIYKNADAFQTVDIGLNADALAAIHSNSAFALSGRFDNLQTGDFGNPGDIPPGTIAFFASANRTADLILTVADAPLAAPEPEPLMLAGAGFALLAALRRTLYTG